MTRRSLRSYRSNFPIAKHADHAYTSKVNSSLDALDMDTQFYKNIKRHKFEIDNIYSYSNEICNNRFKIGTFLNGLSGPNINPDPS